MARALPETTANRLDEEIQKREGEESTSFTGSIEDAEQMMRRQRDGWVRLLIEERYTWPVCTVS